MIGVGAAGGAILWQRTEIARLRADAARQQASLEQLSDRIAAAEDAQARAEDRMAAIAVAALSRRAPATFAREAERRLILSRYRDLLAELSLPAATRARLEDLLVDRVETVLDAEDAGEREGIAEDSPAMTSAELQAVAGVDRAIVELLGSREAALLAAPAGSSAAAPEVQVAVSPPVVVVAPIPEPAPADYAAPPAGSAVPVYYTLPVFDYVGGGWAVHPRGPPERRRRPEPGAGPPSAPSIAVAATGISAVRRR